MFAGKSEIVIRTVNGDVLKMTFLHLLDGILDSSHALAGRSHLLGGVVGVAYQLV